MSTFRTTRHFSASPQAVYAAFEQPECLAQWWGPEGFRNTFDVFDFRPGGVWRFTMHAPDGAAYPNDSSFVAIEPGRRIVVRHHSWPHFQLTIGLEESGAGTLVSWEQAFDSAEVAASLKHVVEPANEQNLTRWQRSVAARDQATHG